MIANHFSLSRFYLLSRNTIFNNVSKIFIVIAVVGALVILVSGLSAFRQTGDQLHIGLYVFFLFISGILVSSGAFGSLREDINAGAWLTIPASIFEKFTSRLFLTSIGYVLATALIYFAISALSEGINRVLFDYSHPLFNPFTSKIWIPMTVYLVVQSVFLTGSIFFRRFAFIKTLLFLSILSLALVLFFFLALKIILGGQFGSLSDQGMRIVWNSLTSDWLLELKDTLVLMAKALFWGILAPFCWVVSYFRLREFEA